MNDNEKFNDFMREVDSIMIARVGLGHRDIEDYMYRDAFDNGMSAYETVTDAVESSDTFWLCGGFEF